MQAARAPEKAPRLERLGGVLQSWGAGQVFRGVSVVCVSAQMLRCPSVCRVQLRKRGAAVERLALSSRHLRSRAGCHAVGAEPAAMLRPEGRRPILKWWEQRKGVVVWRGAARQQMQLHSAHIGVDLPTCCWRGTINRTHTQTRGFIANTLINNGGSKI